MAPLATPRLAAAMRLDRVEAAALASPGPAMDAATPAGVPAAATLLGGGEGAPAPACSDTRGAAAGVPAARPAPVEEAAPAAAAAGLALAEEPPPNANRNQPPRRGAAGAEPSASRRAASASAPCTAWPSACPMSVPRRCFAGRTRPPVAPSASPPRRERPRGTETLAQGTLPVALRTVGGAGRGGSSSPTTDSLTKNCPRSLSSRDRFPRIADVACWRVVRSLKKRRDTRETSRSFTATSTSQTSVVAWSCPRYRDTLDVGTRGAPGGGKHDSGRTARPVVRPSAIAPLGAARW